MKARHSRNVNRKSLTANRLSDTLSTEAPQHRGDGNSRSQSLCVVAWQSSEEATGCQRFTTSVGQTMTLVGSSVLPATNTMVDSPVNLQHTGHDRVVAKRDTVLGHQCLA